VDARATLAPVKGRFLALPGALFIAIAAALWGTDALLRRPLAHSTQAATIVFGEHLILVLLMLPLIPGALVAVHRAGRRYVAAAAVIGVGASAIATILFTQAFVQGDPVTPVVLQKVQPLVAVVCAWFILGERPRRGFAWFLVAGVAGVWLIAFPSPFEIHVAAALPAIYALGAATLWALGTVLGRLLATRLWFEHVTALRFAFGLPASALAVLVVGAPFTTSASDFAWIAVLAVVTGLVALSLYYYGLRRTPAVIATLAELTFPVTAAAVGYFAFGATLDGSQWLGLALTTTVVALLPVTGLRVLRVRGEKLLPATN
jgi:drug/metabolite transporter, DME family